MPNFGYVVPVNFYDSTYSFVLQLHPVVGPYDPGPGAGASVATHSFSYGATAKISAITLPNGAVYDPYQTYDAPIVPGTIQGKFHVLPYYGANDQQIAANIDTQLDAIYAVIGKRGLLRAIVQRPATFNGSAVECTARLTSISITAGPLHDAYEAGPIQSAPAFDLVWQQFSNWEAFTP